MRILMIVIFLLYLFTAKSVEAKNKALIIGIGPEYGGKYSINGPETDLKLAVEIAYMMGFDKKEIMVLDGNSSTRENLIKGLKWLRSELGPSGRLFLYFSGHGTQVEDKNGDEFDGCDEALVPVDRKLLIDDEISSLLENLPEVEKIIIIDSCYSGTITRGVYSWNNNSNIKFYNRGTVCNEAVNRRSVRDTKKLEALFEERGKMKKTIILTATAQNEIAYGDLTESGKGSLFTQALYDTINSREGFITFRELHLEAVKKVRELSEKFDRIPHTPQIDGDIEYFDKPINLKSPQVSHINRITPETKPSTEQLSDIAGILDKVVNSSKFMVAIKAKKKNFRIGEEIQFSVISSKEGFLNIFELESNNNLNLIFPNAYVTNNKIKAHREIIIPDSVGNFSYVAGHPTGKSRIFAIVTREPLNFYEFKNIGQISDKFKSILKRDFRYFKDIVLESIPILPEKTDLSEYGASSMHIEIRD